MVNIYPYFMELQSPPPIQMAHVEAQLILFWWLKQVKSFAASSKSLTWP